MAKKIRRLYFDIEVSPNVVTSWNVGYKQKIDYQNIVKERAVICICWKWDGSKKVHSLSWDKNLSDRNMLIEFMQVANEADELVGHNGDSFDIKWLRTRCLVHGISMFPSYTSLDTLTKARSGFRFNSNRLDYISQFLKVGGKTKTDYSLWTNVCNGDRKALAEMVKYCANDVLILEKVYKKMAPYIVNKIHHGALHGNGRCSCPECASKKVKLSKVRTTTTGIKKYQLQCDECNKYFTVSETTYKTFVEK